jgi:hypothetical protein
LYEIYRTYKENRIKFYGYEKRWPEQPFWDRRRMQNLE